MDHASAARTWAAWTWSSSTAIPFPGGLNTEQGGGQPLQRPTKYSSCLTDWSCSFLLQDSERRPESQLYCSSNSLFTDSPNQRTSKFKLMWMGIGVGVGGNEGEKSLCFVQPDVKGWWCFSCIVSFLTVSLINGKRRLLMSRHFVTCSQGRKLIHCFSLFQLGHNPTLSAR